MLLLSKKSVDVHIGVDLSWFKDKLGVTKWHKEWFLRDRRRFRLRLIDTKTKNGRKHKRGVDALNVIKISHPTVTQGIRNILGNVEYRKMLVVRDVEDCCVIEKAKSVYGIEIWKMSGIIDELMGEVKSRPHRDDVLRTLQLVSQKEKT